MLAQLWLITIFQWEWIQDGRLRISKPTNVYFFNQYIDRFAVAVV